MKRGSARAGVARRLLLLPLAAGALAGCGSDPTGGSEREADVERLRALGYVGFTEAVVVAGESPVSVYDPARSAPGYNLVSNRDLTSAQLFDARGVVRHAWRDTEGHHWSNAELLPDGDLLVTGSEQDGSGDRSNYLLRLAWNGETRWRKAINAHHDAELTPDGTLATLTFRFRSIPEISRDFQVKDHFIALLDGNGELLAEASLYDLLRTDPEVFRFEPVAPNRNRSRVFVDLLHANSLEFMRHEHLAARHPIYAPGNILVSLRSQDTVAIFDWKARRVVWAWGRGEISAQHDARVLPSGNLLLFDNGLDRGWSRIVELDPLRREIVWEYRSPEPRDFFSLRKGSSQRLPNGNTLVANSDSGEAFEVTREGEIVWRFRNPNADAQGNRATIVRIHRYPLAFIDRLLGATRGSAG